MAKLTYLDYEGNECYQLLNKSAPVATVGRQYDCSIRTDDPSVSRVHATFRWRDGHYEVEDNGSTNMTTVNDNPPLQNQRVPISYGDRILCGNFGIIFEQFEGEENTNLDFRESAPQRRHMELHPDHEPPPPEPHPAMDARSPLERHHETELRPEMRADLDPSSRRDLVVLAAVGRIAEPILADGAARVNGHAITQDAAVVDNRVGVENAVGSDAGILTDVNPRRERGALADFGPALDRHKRARSDAFGNDRLQMNRRPLVDAVERMTSKAVEGHHRLAEREVGIAAADQRSASPVVVFGHDDGGGLGFTHEAQILLVGQEGHVPFPGGLQRGNAANGGLPVAVDATADSFGLFCQGHFSHGSPIVAGGGLSVQAFRPPSSP